MVFFHKMIIPENRRIAALIVYQLSNLSAIFAILVVPYRSMIISKEHMKAFAYISIVEAFAKMFIAYCLSVAGFDRLILYGTLLFIMQVSIMYLYSRYCKNHLKSHISQNIGIRKFSRKCLHLADGQCAHTYLQV